MNHARAERQALCDLFDRLGPDVPTLCEGWTAFDLAAHLVLRERRLDALPGIALAPLASHTVAVQRSLKAEHGFAGLVRLVRSGPGGLYRLVPGLDAAVNTLEFFVHHEDLRRAQPGWEPRELSGDLEALIWRRLSKMAWLMLRRAPVAVVMRGPGGAVARGGRRGGPAVRLSGPPSELLLFCFGRQAHARVEAIGEERAVALLRSARLGV
ncbi:TIGR03085 family metal-binding protein [Thermostaphylospora chromogena]|uniref:TIGR03085 family protein n=1 Tax=Thermostaphylospora chromogena TaxID=35622 RepID=A0A1H1GDG9_9ACTN|nr:TIGR03085 family metal-binding protein [Thermostaphylospora chromogena]SDR11240.1 TIGR03085 family protein [Thermostaphylospora chromogena]